MSPACARLRASLLLSVFAATICFVSFWPAPSGSLGADRPEPRRPHFTDIAPKSNFAYRTDNNFTGRKYFPQAMCGGVAAFVTRIAAACRDSECLRFAYRSRDGKATRREVEPHSLVNRGRRWYLVAWDRRREDWRSFRVDRLDRPASMGVRFAARALPAKDPAAYVEQSISAAPNRYAARVTVHASMEEITSRLPS